MVHPVLASRSQDRQFCLGLISLAAGVLVYVVGRPPASVWFLPSVLAAARTWSPALGRLSGSIPTFAHAIGFSLMTTAIVDADRRGSALICLAWVVVETAFEGGQHPWFATRIASVLPRGVARNFFLLGRFDWRDLVAAMAGGAVAFAVIVASSRQEGFT